MSKISSSSSKESKKKTCKIKKEAAAADSEKVSKQLPSQNIQNRSCDAQTEALYGNEANNIYPKGKKIEEKRNKIKSKKKVDVGDEQFVGEEKKKDLLKKHEAEHKVHFKDITVNNLHTISFLWAGCAVCVKDARAPQATVVVRERRCESVKADFPSHCPYLHSELETIFHAWKIPKHT